jgi:hypothetical protein
MSTNLYDQSVHILAVQAFEGGECAQYRDAESVKGPEHAKLREDCQAKLGPNAPGVDTPDPTADDAPPRQIDYVVPPAPEGRRKRSAPRPKRVPASRDEEGRKVDEPKREEERKREDDRRPEVPKPPAVELPKPEQVLPGAPPVPELPRPQVPDAVGKAVPQIANEKGEASGKLLDYLLGS